MRRRHFIALSVVAVADAFASFAEASRIPRVGYLAFTRTHYTSFTKGLRTLGYVEGRNLAVEYRFANGDLQRLPGLLSELIARKLDVLVTADPPSFAAALDAKATVPIVMRASSDPVANRWVSSLARPGGNITGVFSLYSELNGKRLALLKEILPTLSNVLLLWDERFAGERDQLNNVRQDAQSLGLQTLPIAIRHAEDIDRAVARAAAQRVDAMMALRSPLIRANANRVVAMARQYRLPAIYDESTDVMAGGLMSYGANLDVLYDRLAVYVDRILKGAQPGDVPIEQPTQVELVINKATAKALHISIPGSILLRADRLVE